MIAYTLKNFLLEEFDRSWISSFVSQISQCSKNMSPDSLEDVNIRNSVIEFTVINVLSFLNEDNDTY